MRRPASLLVVAALLAACSGAPDTPAMPLPDGPVDIEGVVQHLLEVPDLPGGLDPATAQLAELRAPGLRDRHHVYLVDAPSGTSLDRALVAGAVVRVGPDVTLRSDVAVSTARLDGDTVTEPSLATCDTPCEVAGPALVAPEGWLPGIGVTTGWELVVPAPTE